MLARHLKLDFVDADQELVSRTGVSIANIFQVEGEAGFRVRETQLLAALCERDGLLLATGGGAVLNQEQPRNIAANGCRHLPARHLSIICGNAPGMTLAARYCRQKIRGLCSNACWTSVTPSTDKSQT